LPIAVGVCAIVEGIWNINIKVRKVNEVLMATILKKMRKDDDDSNFFIYFCNRNTIILII